jgi:hypothetical protein
MGAMRCPAVRVCLLVVLVACNKAADAPPKLDQPLAAPVQKAAPARPAKLQQVTLKALGMYCEDSCPVKVRYALADNPSVYELGFDVSTESIFVSYDASLGTPKDVTRPMLAAIKTKAGFDPWLAKETWPDDAQGKVQVVWR